MMYKINHCSDIVSEFDIETLEYIEWLKLINDQSILNEKFHQCQFNTAKFDCWQRGLTYDELKDYYHE